MQAEMYPLPLASKLASACVRATSILSVIPGCRGTPAEKSAWSTAIMAFLSFRTPTPTSSARSPSTSTPCASPRANCGASKLHKRILFILTLGPITLRTLVPIRQPQVLADLPQLPPDADGPLFAQPCQPQAVAL